MYRLTPLTLLAAASALVFGAASAHGQVRISQVYGAGGLSAGQPNADFVELYNAGAAPVDISGWALQFSNATPSTALTLGWNWTRVDIPSGMIAPGGYFLVQVYSPASATGTALPTPDVIAPNTSDLIIEPSGTMVALESFGYDFPTFFCPVGVDGALMDLVSFGGVLNCSEGSALAPATALSAPFQSIFRRGAGCQDTDNNANDFYVGAPSPRNTASGPANPLYFSHPVLSSASVNAGGSTTLTVTVASCAGGPSPEFTNVTVNLSAFGLGASVPMLGGPTVWSLGVTVPGSQAPGLYTIPISGTDGTNSYADSVPLSVIAGLPTNDLCENATILNAGSMPTSISVVTSGASTDVDPGTCNAALTNGPFGIWYVFVPPTDGTLLFERNLATSTQFFRCGIFEVLSSTPSPASDCVTFTSTNSLACAVGNTWGVRTLAGRSYYILVSQSSATAPTTPATGTFSFVPTSSAPTNDDCPGVIDITSMLDTSVVVNITGANNDTVMTNGSNALCIPEIGTQGAWYRYTATGVGSLSMNYWPGTISTGQGIKWAVWERPSSEPTTTACANLLTSANPDYCSNFGVLNLTTSAGMTYYILCYNGNNGSGFINVTQVADIQLAFHFEPGMTPANDECVNALDVSATTLGPITTTTGTILATTSIDETFINGLAGLPCAPTATTVYNEAVWFKYVATQDGVWRFLAAAAPNVVRVVWEVPTDTPNPCALFTVNNLYSCTRQAYHSTPIRAGKTYYMCQFRSSTTGLTPATVLQHQFFPAAQVPVNDTCDGAVDVATILNTRHIVDQFRTSHDIKTGCGAGGDTATNAIWYKFTPAEDCVLVAIEHSPQDAAFALWDAGTSPPADCNARTSAPPTLSQTGLGSPMYCLSPDRLICKAQAGHTYYIMENCTFISGYPTYPFETTFKVLPTLTNEDCSTATTLNGTGAFDLHNVVRYVSTGDNDIVAPDAAFITMNCPTSASTFVNDSWYRWVAPASGPVSFQLRQFPKPPVGMRLAFYTADTGGACPTSVGTNLVRCLGAGAPYPDSGSVTFSPIAGQVYYIQFASTTGSSSEPIGWAVLEINQAPAATGSCCNGTACTVTSGAACAGTYGGDGTTCSPTSATVRAFVGAGGTLLDSGGVDNSSGSLVTSVNVPDAFSVADVEVDVSMAHAKYGDIRITLTKGSTTLILADRGRRGFSPADAAAKGLIGPTAYRFSDASSQSWFSVGNIASPAFIPTGTYKPAGAIGVGPGFKNTFNGIGSAGVWTLRIEDEASSNTGTVSGWVLRLRQAADTSNPCDATQNCCRGTTCNPVSSGTCTGTVAGSNSLVVGSCGTGNAFATCCFADFNHDGTQSIDDLFLYFNAYFTSSPWADFGGDGMSQPTIDDLFLYINAYFGTCS